MRPGPGSRHRSQVGDNRPFIPARDLELNANLGRMAAARVTACYYAADVTDKHELELAVARAQRELGPITAFLHGAGTNTPRLLDALEERDFANTLRPKVAGARNVLDLLDHDRLRLFISFGSLIARSGMKGESDYALANEWLTDLTEQWGRDHPWCRCL